MPFLFPCGCEAAVLENAAGERVLAVKPCGPGMCDFRRFLRDEGLAFLGATLAREGG